MQTLATRVALVAAPKMDTRMMMPMADNPAASAHTMMEIPTRQTMATPMPSAPAPMNRQEFRTVVTPVTSVVPAPAEIVHPNPSPILVGTFESKSPASSLVATGATSSSPVSMLDPVNESTFEYPNGDICYQVLIEDDFTLGDYRGVGWATFVYGHNKSPIRHSLLKACLGNYECPLPNCEYHERPRVPRGSKNKKSLPLATGTFCPRHKVLLVHRPCDVTLKISHRLVNRFFEIDHRGSHCHRRPHPIQPDVKSRREFARLIHAAPEATPKQLQVGNYSRPPVTLLHNSFGNLSRLAVERTKVLRHVRPTSTIGMLATFEKSVGKAMIVSTSMSADDGHIVMITSFQKECLLEAESSIQTDSVEGFLVDDYCPTANVTMTTGFCSVLN
jgi:hypothetical protein